MNAAGRPSEWGLVDAEGEANAAQAGGVGLVSLVELATAADQIADRLLGQVEPLSDGRKVSPPWSHARCASALRAGRWERAESETGDSANTERTASQKNPCRVLNLSYLIRTIA